MFGDVAEGAGIEMVRIPPRSPNLNAHCERFLRSVREECLDHLLILSERQMLDALEALDAYVRYSSRSRPHQGIGQKVPDRSEDEPAGKGEVIELPILGGLHHEDRRAA